MRFFCFLAVFVSSAHHAALGADHSWLKGEKIDDTFWSRFGAPEGFERKPVAPNSFAEWLRNLPLLPGKPDVLLFDGRLKANQSAHLAVIDIDVGKSDLQQCADAVMRLRAEYLWASGKKNSICFPLTNRSPARWTDWYNGKRPQVKGNRVTWSLTKTRDDSYDQFRNYLDFVFTYAGSASLEQWVLNSAPAGDVRAGDVLIQGGHPGHAVLVIDVVVNAKNERRVALMQSYMPAQQMHVLRNTEKTDSVWYSLESGAATVTPEWSFGAKSLARFGDDDCRNAR